MITNVDDIIEVMSEYAAPYLFIGSGFSKRYANSPDWESLLKMIAGRYKINLGLHMLACRNENNPQKIDFPKLGSKLNEELEIKRVENDSNFDFRKITPIKEECVEIFKDIHNRINFESEEIKLFKEVLMKISGIITTNYDLILEELTKDLDFESFIGQSSLINKNLVFSDEIYKIHGCVTERESLIITEADYKKFENRQKYILGKLTVIFAEFPLIFIGYSLEDENIKKILKDLMISLSYEELKKVSEKWLFVEYKSGEQELQLNERRIELEDGNRLIFNCIETDNYTELYKKILKINYKMLPQRKAIKYIKKIIAEYELKPNSKILVQPAENIEEIISAFKEGQQVSLSFGTIKEFLNISYFDLMQDVICENNSNCSLRTKGFAEEYIKTVRGTYYPRYKYFTIEELDSFRIDQLGLEDINWTGVITKAVNDTFKNSSDIGQQIQYWAKEIVENNNLNLDDLRDFLKKLLENKSSLDEVKKVYSLKAETSLKKLVTAYDILRYKK